MSSAVARFCSTLFQLRLGSATFLALPHSSFSTFPSKEPPSDSETATINNNTARTLTDEELTRINHLIPRLCQSNQLPTALRLTATALLTNPPLESLSPSLSLLVDSLASQPDMTQAMSLLTHLKHTPRSHPYIPPITLALISSYFDNRNCKHALTVFRWLQRPDSPCSPDENVYRILVRGFCGNGFVLEALKVLRAMVGANVAPGSDSKECVYRGLLREARIKEATKLNDALGLSCAGSEGLNRVLMLLDHMIAEWTD